VSALIKHGSIEDISVEPVESMSAIRRERFGDIKSFGILEHVAPLVSFSEYQYPTSSGPRGLALKRLRLNRQAQKFFKRQFNLKSNIYVLSWAWDLSGEAVFVYPTIIPGATPALVRMKGDGTQTFLGSGELLFPARPVVGGLQLRLQVWQSAKGLRTFGKAMHDVATKIDQSELNQYLRPLSMAIPHTLMAKAAEELAVKLVAVIGEALSRYGDEMVNLFAGYYPARELWPQVFKPDKAEGATIYLTPLR